jgi:hypothetical protein
MFPFFSNIPVDNLLIVFIQDAPNFAYYFLDNDIYPLYFEHLFRQCNSEHLMKQFLTQISLNLQSPNMIENLIYIGRQLQNKNIDNINISEYTLLFNEDFEKKYFYKALSE